MQQKETKNPTGRSKGAILILTTILLFVILGMVVSLSYVTVMEQKMSQKTKSSVGAFYNSESGIEWALNKIANGSGTISSALTGLTTYNDGKIDCPFSGNSCSVYFLDTNGIVIPKTAFGTKYISDVKAVRSVGNQGGETQRAIEAATATAGEPGDNYTAWGTEACDSDYTAAYTGIVIQLYTVGSSPICSATLLSGSGFSANWTDTVNGEGKKIKCAVCVKD